MLIDWDGNNPIKIHGKLAVQKLLERKKEEKRS